MHTGAYPPSPRSSDLSQASLYFNLVVNPHELSYWDISPPVEFACIIILVSPGFESLDQIIFLSFILSCQFESGPHLYRSVIHHVSLSWGRTYINRPSSYQFSFWGCTYINRASSCQFESGPHLYRSVIHHVSLSRGRTYIDRPSSYQFSSSRDRTYIDRSFVVSV